MTRTHSRGTPSTSVDDPRLASRASKDARIPLAVQRLRLAVLSIALAALVFSQSARRTASDTKLDLVVDPARFMHRAMTLWDPIGAAGQLQNQAYGYLFPMGPFFALGKLAGLPPWVVQRSWQSALVVAAFLGAVRLARLLGVEAFWPKVGAGLTYALAPRMLTELGSISSELMPVAALPWVIIPLVAASSRGSPRRAAALSGIALLFAGGVNAAATLAILPAPALWLMTRKPGARRRQLIGWWSLAVVLACAWWMIPLVLLGRYSPPFLDWIEPSEITTGVTSLIGSLRGADHWQAYLGSGVWPAGWIMVVAPAAILATAAVAAAGVAGLARRDLQHRLFLRSCLLVGLVLVTAGFVATVGPPFGSSVRTLLDGPLTAFRNIHKFDPLIRLPLAIGVGHLLSRIAVPQRHSVRWGTSVLDVRPRLLVTLVVLSIGAVAIAPAVTNNLMPQPRLVIEASWWRQAGSWLGAHEGGGRALVVPGASRPVYLWGSPVDDALQPVATSPWTVRDSVPLTQAGYIRLLDNISLRLATGRADQVLPALLARAGVRYLVVRNDLDAVASGATNLALVHATIASTAGLARVASFGSSPPLPSDRHRLTDVGATESNPPIEIYGVADWSGQIGVMPSGNAISATGSADQLGALLERGVSANVPVLFGTDASSAGLSGETTIATDGIRRREVNFGQSGASPATMTKEQAYRQRRPVHDYLPADPGTLSTYVYGGGVTDVRASSSGADPGAILNAGASHAPWSAIDGYPSTSWESSAFAGAARQWLSVSLANPISVATVTVAFTAGLGGYPTRIEVRTDTGTRESDVEPGPEPQDVQLPPGPTRGLRLRVVAASDGTRSVGISSLLIPGMSPTRSLEVPTSGAPDILAFDTEPGGRASCVTVRARAACDPSFASAGEEAGLLDRTFTLTTAQQYLIAAGVTLRGGRTLDAMLSDGQSITAAASSTDSLDPRERPAAAVDGDPNTSWVAAVGDRTPSLNLRFADRRHVSALRIDIDADAPIAKPAEVEIAAAGKKWTLGVPADGVVTLPHAVRAASVHIRVVRAELRSTTSTLDGTSRLLPAGISEVDINDVPNEPSPDAIHLRCTDGVDIAVDDLPVPLHATASRADVLAGLPVLAKACGDMPVQLSAGTHRVWIPATDATTPDSITLSRPGTVLGAAASSGSASPVAWSASRRTIQVSTNAPSILVVRENANAGWRASFNGHRLRSIRLDGWQQGWEVPAGVAGIVTLTYAPQTEFEIGLLVGLFCALLLVAMALVRGRGRAWTSVTERPVYAGLTVAVAVSAAFLLGGVVGLGVVSGVYVMCWGASQAGRRMPYWAGAIAIGIAGCMEAYAPSAGSAHPLAGSPGAQVLCVTGICLVVLGTEIDGRQGRENRRSSGRSTKYHDNVPSSVADAAVSTKNSQ